MKRAALALASILPLAACATGSGGEAPPISEPPPTREAPPISEPAPPRRPPVVSAEPASPHPRSTAERAAEAERALELQGTTQEHLAALAELPLESADQETVAIVRGLLEESSAALEASDTGAALRLAEKAETLARDLRRKVE